MAQDNLAYYRYTSRARVEKAVNSLLGIIEGIAADRDINPAEVSFLHQWIEDQSDVANRHPFSELVPQVLTAISDRRLTEEEKLNLKWLCERLSARAYFSDVTADVQRLHAVLGGIAADGEIHEAEVRGLSDWLDSHEHLRRTWPYEEVLSVVTAVLASGKVEPEEHKLLDSFFSQFVKILDSKTITSPPVLAESSINGLCAVCPEVLFDGKSFCLTGQSTRFSRKEFTERLESVGARVVDNVVKTLDYLIVGADGNPCWAYACYGRKVERAVELRKAGQPLLIVHENDLHDALADL